MYKVFIDNKSVIFNVETEKQLLKQFPDYKFVEAAGGIVQRDSSFLFIKRNGFWDIPKGKLEKGESPEVGAVREIEEECGLMKPQIKDHLLNTFHTYEHKGSNVLKKTYWYWLLLTEKKVQLIPQTEEGITEVKFFEIADFDTIEAETYLSIAEVLQVLKHKVKKLKG